MKKVMQTKTGLGGNCEGATIATLLGLELSEIPDFWDGIDIKTTDADESGAIYQENLNSFLKQHGYKMLNLGVTKDPTQRDINWVIEVSKAIGTKHLVAGISPRGYMHSVIYENGELWHDPHPEGGGVIPCQICLLVPIFKSLSEKVSITKDQLRRVSEEQLKAYMEEKPVSEKDKFINL